MVSLLLSFSPFPSLPGRSSLVLTYKASSLVRFSIFLILTRGAFREDAVVVRHNITRRILSIWCDYSESVGNTSSVHIFQHLHRVWCLYTNLEAVPLFPPTLFFWRFPGSRFAIAAADREPDPGNAGSVILVFFSHFLQHPNQVGIMS